MLKNDRLHCQKRLKIERLPLLRLLKLPWLLLPWLPIFQVLELRKFGKICSPCVQLLLWPGWLAGLQSLAGTRKSEDNRTWEFYEILPCDTLVPVCLASWKLNTQKMEKMKDSSNHLHKILLLALISSSGKVNKQIV